MSDTGDPSLVGRDLSGTALSGVVVGCVLAVVLLWNGIAMVRPAWAVSQGRGVQGSFVVELERCGRQCSYYGTFTSTDGALVIPKAHLLHGGDHVGERVPSVHLSDGLLDPGEVHARHSNALGAGIALTGTGALVSLGSAAVLVEQALRQWRRQRRESAALARFERRG